MKNASVLILILLVSAHALSENNEKSLFTDLELGFIASTGNTETMSLRGRINTKHDLEKFKNNYVVEAFFREDKVRTESNGETTTEIQTTAEKYFLSIQSDYKLEEEHKGIFGFGSYEQDKFSSYEYQASIASGYSDRLLINERSYLSFSIGPGAAFNEIRETGESSFFGMLRASAEYLLLLSENAKFTQIFSSEIPFESGQNRKTKAQSALTVKLISNLGIQISFVIDHNSKVTEGIESTDTQTSVTVVYSF